jgi:heme exporter protein D
MLSIDLGPHAAFIWASYLIVVAGLVLLIGWLVVDGRRQQRLIDELDSRGVRRRSASGAGPAGGDGGGSQ